MSEQVIQFLITNNSGQTLILTPTEPKMGTWEKKLDSPLSENSKTEGVVKGPEGSECTPAYTITIGGVEGNVTATAVYKPGSGAVWQTSGSIQGFTVDKKDADINGLTMKCKVVVNNQ